jgi:hypothetical protein
MPGALKTLEGYYLINGDLEKMRGERRLKISFVDLADNRNRFEFLETVAQNRGFNLRIFSDSDKANT